jgi:hypothetical protein
LHLAAKSKRKRNNRTNIGEPEGENDQESSKTVISGSIPERPG